MATVNTAIALVSLDDVKIYLHVADTSLDATLPFFINEVSTKISSYIGYNLVSTTYTEYYDGNGKNKLILKKYPISSITSLYDDPTRLFTSDTLISSSDYYIYSDEGIVELLNGYTYTSGQRNIKITYIAGYSLSTTPAMPEDIKEAAKQWVAFMYAIYKGKRQGLKTESIGDRNTSYDTSAIPESIKQVLDMYRDSSLMVL